jgi:5-methylcytosine-specific restriction endonuclease McrA
MTCFQNPRTKISAESSQHRKKRVYTAAIWFENNPPDEDGYWDCYLQISVNCMQRVNRGTIQLEHIFPKKNYPELAFVVENIKPACLFCNKLKGSKTIYQIAKLFPQVADLIQQPAWQELLNRLESI